MRRILLLSVLAILAISIVACGKPKEEVIVINEPVPVISEDNLVVSELSPEEAPEVTQGDSGSFPQLPDENTDPNSELGSESGEIRSLGTATVDLDGTEVNIILTDLGTSFVFSVAAGAHPNPFDLEITNQLDGEEVVYETINIEGTSNFKTVTFTPGEIELRFVRDGNTITEVTVTR